MILSLWLGARLRRLERRLRAQTPAGAARSNAGKEANAMVLAFGFAPRMLLVLVLLWLGIAHLGLLPLPIIAAFAAAYAVYWVELWRTRLG